MSTIDGADDKTRKSHPIFSGFLKYFPDAALAVAELSRIANEKHNPGEPLHWSRGKSNDHPDCLVRHQLDAGKWDTLNVHGKEYKVRHSAEVAWRAMAQLQLEIEADAPFAASPVPAPVSERKGRKVVDFSRGETADRRVEIDTRATNHLLADRRVFFSGRRNTDTRSWATLPRTRYLK